MQLIKRMTL